jgi:hypothetical protein
MTPPLTIAVLGLTTSLLVGCVSVSQQSAFKAAGSPADRRATLRVGYDLASIKIDGEEVSQAGRGFGTSAWVVEMLPGKHDVQAVWEEQKNLSGTFEAEAGKNYILRTNFTKIPMSGSGYLKVLTSVEIVEVPAGKEGSLSTLQRMGDTGAEANKADLDFKKVGSLQ